MIIKRKTGRGTLRYDTSKHRFSYVQTNGNLGVPYIQNPVVLNIDLTMKCNMSCKHCVTKDFGQQEDLVVSDKIVKWINRSPFMVVVITGGEPFLPEYEGSLVKLLRKIRGKGLVIDTNGTIKPSESLIKTILKTKTLIRVSWDAARPQDEICLRQCNGTEKENISLFNDKIKEIRFIRSRGINVAVQSVVHKKNRTSLKDMPVLLRRYSIKQWYLQRLIPSYHIASASTYNVSDIAYHETIDKLKQMCHAIGIDCITKRDKRHNCVFLMIGDGLLYTQGEEPCQKIPIGKIRNKIRFFDYVSSADHADRYYK